MVVENRYSHTCEQCGKEFKNNKKHQRFCNKSCVMSNRNFTYNDKSFFNGKIDTEEKAYILGLFMADGSISQDKISICQKDIELMNKIKNIINPDRKLYMYNDCYTFMWTNKEDLYYLKSLNITSRKSYDARLKLFNNEFFNHYIRGWFDGDGCIYENKTINKQRGYVHVYKQVSITSASIMATMSWFYFLEELGINATCVIDSRRRDVKYPTYYIKINSKNGVEIFKNYIYDNATIYLNRKYQKFMI